MAAAVLAFAVLVPGGARAASVAGDPDCLREVRGVDLQTATIPELQRLSSVELTEAYLARIAAYDGKLNAIRTLAPDALEQARRLDEERAQGRTRGPLHGVPVLLKDNVGTKDMPTTAGSIALEGARTAGDAAIVEKLRDQGALILGKLELSEFAGWVDLGVPPGWSSLGGQVVNAHDFSATPSGSSAGSGVAASMAFAAATIGTETSGSILSPSTANGIVGLKPTLNAASVEGIVPLAHEFDVAGPMVRTVTDASLIFSAISGTPPASLSRTALEGKTIAYSTGTRDGLQAEEQALFDQALERLRQLGATVTAIDSLGDAQTVGVAEIAAIPNDFKASLNAYLATQMRPETLNARTLSEVVAFRAGKTEYAQTLLEASDATPGLAPLATLQGAATRSAAQAVVTAALAEGGADAILAPGNAHANIGAAAGWPTALVPAGATNRGRTPFAVGFLGTGGDEPALLGYAYAFEQDTKLRRTPTSVNAKLQATCPAAAAPARPELPAVTLTKRGRTLTATARNTTGKVRFVLKRGTRTIQAKTARRRARFTVRRRGTYRVVVVAGGVTARSKAVRVK